MFCGVLHCLLFVISVTKPGQTLALNFSCGVPLCHWISLRGTIVLLLQVPHNLRCTRPPIHTRTNPIPATEWEYTGSFVSVEKCTSVKQDVISLQDLKNIEHTAAEEILRNHLSSSTPYQGPPHWLAGSPTQSHLSTHGIPDASERPSTFSSTTQFHKTIGLLSSAIFGDPYYGPKDLLYPKSNNLPLCLSTTDSFQWAHTPLISVTSTISFPPTHFHWPKDLLYP